MSFFNLDLKLSLGIAGSNYIVIFGILFFLHKMTDVFFKSGFRIVGIFLRVRLI